MFGDKAFDEQMKETKSNKRKYRMQDSVNVISED